MKPLAKWQQSKSANPLCHKNGLCDRSFTCIMSDLELSQGPNSLSMAFMTDFERIRIYQNGNSATPAYTAPIQSCMTQSASFHPISSAIHSDTRTLLVDVREVPSLPSSVRVRLHVSSKRRQSPNPARIRWIRPQLMRFERDVLD